MRRPIRPFAVTFKHGRRHKQPQRPVIGEFDENTVIPPTAFDDDLPSVDLHADSDLSYEEALRAADRVFGKQPEEPPTAREPLPELEPVVPHPAPTEASSAPPEPAPEESTPVRRILPALDQVDPLAERLAAEANRPRRGRPPKTATPVQVPPKLIDPTPRPRGRPRKNPVRIIPFAPAPVLEVAAAPVAADPWPLESPMPVSSGAVFSRPGVEVPRAGEALRAKWVQRTALGPHERWKRRLPQACW